MDRGCLGDPTGSGSTVSTTEYIANEEALRALLASPAGPVGKMLGGAGRRVETEAKRLASQPGRGRTYRRGNVTHIASAPGDPPAVDTGHLRASISSKLAVDEGGLHARIGSNLNKAVYLELGTRRMAARPFLRPALDSIRRGS